MKKRGTVKAEVVMCKALVELSTLRPVTRLVRERVFSENADSLADRINKIATKALKDAFPITLKRSSRK